MEYNRNNQDRHYRRDYHQNPYKRAPPRGEGGTFRPREDNFRSHIDNFRSGDHFRSQETDFGGRENQNWRSERSYRPGSSNNTNQANQGFWQNPPERSFDNRGREMGKFDQPRLNYNQRSSDRNYSEYHGQQSEEISVHPSLTPLEEKAKDFLHTVLRQEGVRAKLIFLETVENALQTLQGTVDYCQLQMTVEQDSTGDFVMKIDREQVAKGTFPTKQAAKNALAEQALEAFRKDCFYIVKKKVYEEVTTKKNEPKVEVQPQTTFQGSKAHQMMLKMGWGGKGLGVKEQGEEKTVAETLDQNVSRQGLGTDDVFKKIHKLLEDYSKSDKISLLRFDPDFTSEERAHIHKIAAKFGLKSKSEGKGEQRRITITKKLHRGDLVYNLLTSELENTLYKLIIPTKFEHLWNDDQEEEDDDDKF